MDIGPSSGLLILGRRTGLPGYFLFSFSFFPRGTIKGREQSNKYKGHKKHGFKPSRTKESIKQRGLYKLSTQTRHSLLTTPPHTIILTTPAGEPKNNKVYYEDEPVFRAGRPARRKTISALLCKQSGHEPNNGEINQSAVGDKREVCAQWWTL